MTQVARIESTQSAQNVPDILKYRSDVVSSPWLTTCFRVKRRVVLHGNGFHASISRNSAPCLHSSASVLRPPRGWKSPRRRKSSASYPAAWTGLGAFVEKVRNDGHSNLDWSQSLDGSLNC